MHVIGLSTWCGCYKLKQRRKQHFWLWRFKPQNTKLPPWVQISSLISLQLNYIDLKGKKRITYLQEMQVNNQKCKLPLVRASHCLPTSRFAPEIIKKKKKRRQKRQKDEKKEWLKASNIGWGAEQFLRFATFCATQRHWHCSLTMLVRQNQPGQHLEGQWVQWCSRKQCLWATTLDEALMGRSNSMVPLLLKISSVQGGVHECQVVYAHCRFWGIFQENIKGSGGFQVICLAV